MTIEIKNKHRWQFGWRNYH